MRTQTRDMTERQFQAALAKHGFGEVGHFGYVALPEPHSNVHVSLLNAGERRRDQLAYLLREAEKERVRP